MVREKGSIDRTIDQAPNIALSSENGPILFSPTTWLMMTFLNPLDAPIPKLSVSLFCRILGPGHLRGPGVSLGRSLGGPSIEPFLGGSSQSAVSTPPP